MGMVLTEKSKQMLVPEHCYPLGGHHWGCSFDPSFYRNKELRSKHLFEKSVFIDSSIFYSVLNRKILNYTHFLSVYFFSMTAFYNA